MHEPVVVPPVFHGHHVKAFFTTKALSCDAGQLAKFLGVVPGKIYMPVQKHTDKVVVVDYDLDTKIGDAVITANRDIYIGIQVADCMPILLFDKKRHVAGAVHAGWRGTATSIVKKTIEAMSSRFFTVPSDIVMAIGPGIQRCCFEVGYEVIAAVTRASGDGDYYHARGEKYLLDLAAANRRQAVSAGVSPDQIWLSDECTFCLPGKYYSYRFEKGSTGRQCGVIGLAG